MKALLALALLASTPASAETIRIVNAPGALYAANEAMQASGEAYLVNPASYEVGKFLESLKDAAGAVCEGKFSFINGEFQVYELTDCKVTK